ncbi:MAG TPA: hypothetical protein VFZ83_12295 [Acidimicrobiia bacterium]|nr:hypothetical protein [Acidimicrobiia bacterium]
MALRLAAHGLDVALPAGWEGRIRRRAATAPGERTYPVVHLATVPLPEERGDFGGFVVDTLAGDDVFVTLFEYGPESVEKPLFATRGLPRQLRADHFSPRRLQRSLPGQTGCQIFFTEGGRAFCLYVVLGDRRQLARGVARVNALLADVRVTKTGVATG